MNVIYYRFFDLVLAIVGLLFSSPVLISILLIGYLESGSPIFRQERVGKNMRPFTLIKFRTMKIGTESMASHLAASSSITQFGAFLRKSKIDELLQLVNVLKGDMSLVGPRPCLYNQLELISERQIRGVFDVLPGITGMAQIQGVDMSEPKRLAKCDSNMIDEFSSKTYFYCLFQTVFARGMGDRVPNEKD